ncbi:uncharacterized protein TRIADDRAFT_51296 [Trichoplax adhaerens]|uniref:U2 snRNP-associated SURP motif-containing protein n=1 Tax=Trichoplax adhaerens TaxID=10228 RepID=B3RIF0_TRIAD|nr:hypothetical protein TRIADDRAFT_51296 [Trichoplax adhaerens]EDV28406.1 hypothetical protein TRIADDRAFT_51296 [Trichoplax adhaerens]|eukprot:XP_002107608.1 hypothetical protein TRIADDRAFT_51296 [Trichoplax adhaerens]
MDENHSKQLPWGLKQTDLAPNSLEKMSQSKLKAFESGTFGVGGVKNVAKNKKEQLEAKKKMDEEAAAEAYASFISSFNESNSQVKTFVKGGTSNTSKKDEETKNKQYKTPKLEAMLKKSTPVSAPEPSPNKTVAISKKKEKEKKKSNLELFKEELKRAQQEREIRHKVRKEISSTSSTSDPVVKEEIPGYGSYDTGDPNTTNLYVGNLNPSIDEDYLCKLFGEYGALASVKIMWPRTDEEKKRNRNCGFVAFMTRTDGDKALRALNGKEIMEYELHVGWGKAVPVPPHPIYIPAHLRGDNKDIPPPPTGLPFNAQVNKVKDDKGNLSKPPPGENQQDMPFDPQSENKLTNTVVIVVKPTDKELLRLIHRTVYFVMRYGPMFEALLMGRETTNPQFRFLFDNQNPSHVYYRWKLFSLLQGDHPYKWKTDDFRMFKAGSWWRPPPLPPKPKEKPVTESKKGLLSSRRREKLIKMLKALTCDKDSIANAMVFCLENAVGAEEIVDFIADSLAILSIPPNSKAARIYLISDILYNCAAKVPHASDYRKFFENKLPEIFLNLNKTYEAITGRMRAEQFKKRIMMCLRAWEGWVIYPFEFISTLQESFLGSVKTQDQEETSHFRSSFAAVDDSLTKAEEDIDGIPLDTSLDGVPMDSDLDGVPLQDDTISYENSSKGYESVISLDSKWERGDFSSNTPDRKEIDSNTGRPGTTSSVKGDQGQEGSKLSTSFGDDEFRRRLREIEVKIMDYRSDLESGRRHRQKGLTIEQQCDQYRDQLKQEIGHKKKRLGDSRSPDISNSRSPRSHSKRARSRSRSPYSDYRRQRTSSRSSRYH